tara:strand:- start:9 stop:230 length:222 start_codon:yes stop_codon:yes gene_type:complete
MTVCAVAFHEHTYAVWELREELQIRFMNMWELLDQLKYVTAEQRVIVYAEIDHIRAEIEHIIDELIRLDKEQH